MRTSFEQRRDEVLELLRSLFPNVEWVIRNQEELDTAMIYLETL